MKTEVKRFKVASTKESIHAKLMTLPHVASAFNSGDGGNEKSGNK